MSAPKDGYYTALIQLDTGGALPAYVRVKDGVIRDSDGDELRLDACSKFNPVSAQQFCGVWPREAAMELEALRTANAGLVERVRRLEEALDTIEIQGDQMNDELYPPDSNCSCHISPPCNDCVDWSSMRMAKRDSEEAKQKAAKAKGHP